MNLRTTALPLALVFAFACSKNTGGPRLNVETYLGPDQTGKPEVSVVVRPQNGSGIVWSRNVNCNAIRTAESRQQVFNNLLLALSSKGLPVHDHALQDKLASDYGSEILLSAAACENLLKNAQ